MPIDSDAQGYWPSRWPGEDGGPRRRAIPRSGSGLAIGAGEHLEVVSRPAPLATMVVLRDPGEVYLLGHTTGTEAISWVERVDPVTLAVVVRSPDLPGGKTWPGGIAAHTNGSLYVGFGRHVHRLTPDLEIRASRVLPRDRPYNSFVILPDGAIALKDFAGALPGGIPNENGAPSELLVLEPEALEITARLQLPEPSIARLSADGATIYAVGDEHLFRVEYDGRTLALDDGFRPRYRTLAGQTYGWDAVLTERAAWFLDNGAGSEGYAGTFVGRRHLRRAAAPGARRSRVRRGRSHRDLRAAERHRRQSAGHRRIPFDRGRLRQRQRRARGLRLRR